MSRPKRICVFCGSQPGATPAFGALADAVGRGIAGRGWGLVYGGAKSGTMGRVADAALAGEAPVYGVIPDRLQQKEIAHPGLSELFVVESMHARKAMMAHLSDAFLVLPGGWGTLEEAFEVITWNQLGYHRKPLVFLGPGGFWDGLLAHAQTAYASGFLTDVTRELLVHHTEVDAALDHLSEAELPEVTRWIDSP